MKKIFFILALMLVGGFLRLYKVDKNPISLNVDEVSIGYNAYSILKTGKDEYGNFMPISFRSLGDYKPPIYIYSVVPSIAIFGVNEFAVRFPSALFGILGIPLFYFFLRTLLKEDRYALVGATIFTFSPWDIYFSRDGSEAHMAMILLLAGLTCLLKVFEKKRWGIIAVFLLVASMYTYHAERVFVPFLIIGFTIWNRKLLFKNKRNLLPGMVIAFLLLLPLAFSLFFGADKTRAQMTFITNDVAFTRTVGVDMQIDKVPSFLRPVTQMLDSNPVLLSIYSARKFLAYFQPSFLFSSGLLATAPGNYGIGVLYLFELPWLLLGLYRILKWRGGKRILLVGWILLGILPAALTLNEQHPIRTLLILPALLAISAVGAVEFFFLMKNKTIYGLFILFIIWNLIQILIIYSVHFPKERGEALMEGSKQSSLYAIAHQGAYKEVVYDPVRGIEGPYITNAPYAYILFYSKYDPATYQREWRNQDKTGQHFGKFTIRQIRWTIDQKAKNTLFIGSPWSIPLQDLKESEILEKIYLSNGKLALVIVSPN